MGCGSSADEQRGKYYGGSSRGFSSAMSGYNSSRFNGSYASSRLTVRGAPRFFIHDNRNFPDGEVNQGSMQKRLRRRLSSCIKSGTLQELEEVLLKCEEFKVHPDDLYFRGIRRVEFLRMRNILLDAVKRKHYSTLRDAIMKVESSPFARELSKQLEASCTLLEELKQRINMETVRHTINYSTVSEVRRFKSPPQCVVDSVRACYLLLGTSPSKLKTWSMIRALMCKVGPNCMLMLMVRLNPEQVPPQQVKTAGSLIRKWTETEVAIASLEAANFWWWAQTTLNKKFSQTNRTREK